MKTLYWFVIFCMALATLGFVAPGSQQVDLVGLEVTRQEIDTNPPAEPVKLIFAHHSSGENWLADYSGGLGLALRDNNYFVSDTNYGWGPDSIGDLTDIGHWWNWFRGPNRDTYLNALYTESNRQGDYFSRMGNDPGGENQIIMFKGCFPNSYLAGGPNDPPTAGDNPLRGQEAWSEAHSVANAKGIYNDLLEYFATRQDKLFIVITAPPLMDGETDAAHAANARAFNNWLVNDWLAGYPHNNVAVFDFYNVLTSSGGNVNTHDAGTESGNHHRIWNGAVQHIQTVGYDMSAYPDGDSHPTAAGNQKAAAEFVPLLNFFYSRWNPGHSAPTAAPAAPPEEEEEEEGEEADQPAEAEEQEDASDEASSEAASESEADQPHEPSPAPEGVIQTFDSLPEWEVDDDGTGSSFELSIDNETVHNGTGSLQIQYNIVPEGWAYYGHSFEPVQDWSAADGISMWLHAVQPGDWATVVLFAGDPMAATPFETYFEITAASCDGWVQFAFPWTAFERAPWVGQDGLNEFDPTQVVGFGLSFGSDDASTEGTLWIDELSLATGELPLPAEDVSSDEAKESAEADEAEESAEADEAKESAEADEVEESAEADEVEESAEADEVEESAEADEAAAPEEPAVPAAPVEEESGGGLCPLSMLILPLMLVTVVLTRKRQ
ncbi:hypothetical protein ACFLXQ_01840 [Chloroflexota bacterium]